MNHHQACPKCGSQSHKLGEDGVHTCNGCGQRLNKKVKK